MLRLEPILQILRIPSSLHHCIRQFVLKQLYFFSLLYFIIIISCLYPILRLTKGKVGILNTNVIGHLIANTSHVLQWMQNKHSQIDKPRYLLIFAARGVCNPYLFKLIQQSLPTNVRFIRPISYLSLKLEVAYNRILEKTRLFDEIFLDIEKCFNFTSTTFTDSYRSPTPNIDFTTVAPYFFGSLSRYRKNILSIGYLETSHVKQVFSKIENLKSILEVPVIGVIDRDGGFKGPHPLRDTYISELKSVCLRLKELGYIVVRLGSRRIEPLDKTFADIDVSSLGLPKQIRAVIDIEIMNHLDFCISWKTGYQEVALLNEVPSIMLDEFYRNDKDNCKYLPATFFHTFEKRTVLVPEMIYRYGIDFEDDRALFSTFRRMPIEVDLVISALNALRSKNFFEAEESRSLLEAYTRSLQVGIEKWHHTPLRETPVYKWNLRRLLNDLSKKPLTIDESFLVSKSILIRQLNF